jgi:hypothetical protein
MSVLTAGRVGVAQPIRYRGQASEIMVVRQCGHRAAIRMPQITTSRTPNTATAYSTLAETPRERQSLGLHRLRAAAR